MKIPRIIHQVWEGKRESTLPTRLQILSDSWKEKNPTWEYRLWHEKDMNELVEKHFPFFKSIYNNFKYDVQRWDTIRYMILYVYGGVYTDLDTECYKSIDDLLVNRNICIGLEPNEHVLPGYPSPLIGNAFLCSSPSQPFWLEVLDLIQNNLRTKNRISDKGQYVMYTTGPLMISEAVCTSKYQQLITLLLSKDVAPISKFDLEKYISDKSNDFQIKIDNSYCAHYFFGSWEKKFSIYNTYDYV